MKYLLTVWYDSDFSGIKKRVTISYPPLSYECVLTCLSTFIEESSQENLRISISPDLAE